MSLTVNRIENVFSAAILYILFIRYEIFMVEWNFPCLNANAFCSIFIVLFFVVSVIRKCDNSVSVHSSLRAIKND